MKNISSDAFSQFSLVNELKCIETLKWKLSQTDSAKIVYFKTLFCEHAVLRHYYTVLSCIIRH